MILIVLQLVVALTLLILAIRVQMSLVRDRKRDFQGILKRFRIDQVGRDELMRFTTPKRDHSSGQPRVMPCRKSVPRLARMYQNMEVLLEAIDFIERDEHSTDHAELDAIKASIRSAQRLFFRAALQRLVAPQLKADGSTFSRVLENYVSVIICLGRFLNRCYPSLTRSYRYFVSWHQLIPDFNPAATVDPLESSAQ